MDTGLVRPMPGNPAVAHLQQAPDAELEEEQESKVLRIVGVKGKAPLWKFQAL